jgi:hypothetical protein
MGIGKLLDPFKPVMAFLALVFVKWHETPNSSGNCRALRGTYWLALSTD